ncbi:MAG: septum formation protein Maf [Clostridiales bacterium 43-6]|nr:MAG: septum formation protein Maf [Clostridiales bacterium 43-6]
MTDFILASASPRRKELILNLPYSFRIETKETDEILDPDAMPEENVMAIARQKAAAVAQDNRDSLVVGCDTVVVYDSLILGKPKDAKDAGRMLRLLSGNTHRVYTGVSLILRSKKLSHSFFVCTEVSFKQLTEDEINRYVATEEPLDKAGAYGIQQYGSLFVEKIHGDYFNVVGLPINRLYTELQRTVRDYGLF